MKLLSLDSTCPITSSTFTQRLTHRADWDDGSRKLHPRQRLWKWQLKTIASQRQRHKGQSFGIVTRRGGFVKEK